MITPKAMSLVSDCELLKLLSRGWVKCTQVMLVMMITMIMMDDMYAAPFTIERGRAALAAILSAFETPPHLGRKIIRQYASSECVENLLSIAQRFI